MTQAGFGEVAEALRRTTVQVSSRERGFGSGVILSSDGLMVTNAHVVRSSHAQVKLWDGRTLEAAVTSRDLARDLAALLASGADLPAATLADSSKARVGELVLAVGNPLGFVGALSTGIIHAAGSVRGLGMTFMATGRCETRARKFRRPTGRCTRSRLGHQHHGRGWFGARDPQQ